MRVAILGCSILALAACGGASTSEETQVAKGPCADVEMIMAAKSDAEPFQSLRGDNVMLGERPLEDKWVSRVSSFEGRCEINAMRGFFGEPTDIHTYGCILFEAGNFDREENEAKARAVLDDIETTLIACLGDEWTVEETTEKMDFDVYRKLKFSPVNEIESEAKFKADALYAEMSFTPFMRGRGGKSGWDVHVQFQEMVDTSGD